jgi:hypothetical protein
VKYHTSAAFRTALETRLKATQSDGVGLARLRKRVVFERLLARLHAVAPDAWVLKGGFALELRLGAQARTTKDIDVDWAIAEDEAVELLLQGAAMPLKTNSSSPSNDHRRPMTLREEASAGRLPRYSPDAYSST